MKLFLTLLLSITITGIAQSQDIKLKATYKDAGLKGDFEYAGEYEGFHYFSSGNKLVETNGDLEEQNTYKTKIVYLDPTFGITKRIVSRLCDKFFLVIHQRMQGVEANYYYTIFDLTGQIMSHNEIGEVKEVLISDNGKYVAYVSATNNELVLMEFKGIDLKKVGAINSVEGDKKLLDDGTILMNKNREEVTVLYYYDIAAEVSIEKEFKKPEGAEINTEFFIDAKNIILPYYLEGEKADRVSEAHEYVGVGVMIFDFSAEGITLKDKKETMFTSEIYEEYNANHKADKEYKAIPYLNATSVYVKDGAIYVVSDASEKVYNDIITGISQSSYEYRDVFLTKLSSNSSQTFMFSRSFTKGYALPSAHLYTKADGSMCFMYNNIKGENNIVSVANISSAFEIVEQDEVFAPKPEDEGVHINFNDVINKNGNAYTLIGSSASGNKNGAFYILTIE